MRRSKTSSGLQLTAGSPIRLGAHFDGNGVNFAVFSQNAARIELCLFSEDGKRELTRVFLPERTGPVWHGYAAGLKPGSLYGYRAHGAYDPEKGHRFNPNKLLLDPYTTGLFGQWSNDSVLLGYEAASPVLDLSYDSRDSAHAVPKSVVSDPDWNWDGDERPNRPHDESVIYEAHVKGLTQLRQDIPQKFRGNYEGLACEPVLEHLDKLGVTTIELMPVHAFLDDGFLLQRGLKNYWGYNSIGFFAPEPRYFGPNGIRGFREMVGKFHAAGIEVILDVVFNHTAEGDHRGPTLCFRGLDNASYYHLIAGQPRYYVNDTGCGNTVNISHPYVLRLVLDSLRFWVEKMHVDGFRFDLATTLGREAHGFDPHGGFFDALRQDPLLATVKLIAEPWDLGPGGYRVGEFPHEFAELNDRFRDTARKFWRGDGHSTQELASRLLGSADNFDRDGRRAWSSVNFLASHDGFTLADLTSYNDRHNEANGESNHDGHHSNFSDNCGAEGATDDQDILSRRSQRRRNLLATLFLSQGTPMMLAGDELANSQDGNNNAYCQDNAISWIDWQRSDDQLLACVQQLVAFRRAHSCLRQTRFLHGAIRSSDKKQDIEWRDLDGDALNWRDPGLSSFCLLVRGSAEATLNDSDEDAVFIVFNREESRAEVTLPEPPSGKVWARAIDTSFAGKWAGASCSCATETVAGDCVVAFALLEQGDDC